MKQYIYKYRNELVKTVVATFIIITVLSLLTYTEEKVDLAIISLNALSITGRAFFILIIYLFIKRTR
jgi:uncharacterized membrane protein